MNGHDEQELDSPFHRVPIRFSLLALLIFTTLACLALAWIVRPRRVVAEALFQVSSKEPVLVGRAPVDDPGSYEKLQQSQLVLLKSNFVLNSAIRDPSISTMPLLAAVDDPVSWLTENLEVAFLDGSEILSIRLRGADSVAGDLQHLVDAVAKAYEKEVVYSEKQRRLLTRDAKVRTQANLRKELFEKLEELEALKKELGAGSANSTAVKVRQMDVDVLNDLCRQLIRSIELDDIEANAPERIRLIQHAVVTEE
jgi:hypothetical protein